METVTAILIGAGNRGRYVFGAYATRHPDRLRIVAVAEPITERREAAARELGLDGRAVFADWRDLLAAAPTADAVIVATGDREHVEPTLAAVAGGYHVLLEKPIAPDAVDCVRVVEAAERAGRLLQIGHVLRYSAFYERVYEVVASGRLGTLSVIDMREHVAHWHFTHSYVRGKFRNAALAAPFLLAKSCHDLDLLAWFAARPALRITSFGGRAHYTEKNAPVGATARCIGGCSVQATCAHDAERFYLGPDDRVAKGWPWTDVSGDPTRAARRAALERGPYGRCVFRCDNDVADHQIVAVEFEDGLVATLGIHGHGAVETRTLRISGSRGELRGNLAAGELELSLHGGSGPEKIAVEGRALGHFGGDQGLLDHFCSVVARGAAAEVRASGRVALDGHLLGFAAERARRDAEVVDLDGFRKEVYTAAAAAVE